MADSPNDINDTKPSSIRHIVGQRSVIEQIGNHLDQIVRCAASSGSSY